MDEGVCFRNCFNKINTWYPMLRKETEGAAFKTYWQLTEELAQEMKRN